MTQKTIQITNPTGLHTRPGTQFVQLAKRFEAEITVSKGEKSFSAKSLLKLMKIGISQGDEIELCCEGTDEEQAMAQLEHFVAGLKE